MAIGYDQKQKIEYNPNKKSVVNGYIDKAVSNLKSAKNKTDSVLRSKPFPSKTIIGKKFKNLQFRIARGQDCHGDYGKFNFLIVVLKY